MGRQIPRSSATCNARPPLARCAMHTLVRMVASKPGQGGALGRGGTPAANDSKRLSIPVTPAMPTSIRCLPKRCCTAAALHRKPARTRDHVARQTSQRRSAACQRQAPGQAPTPAKQPAIWLISHLRWCQRMRSAWSSEKRPAPRPTRYSVMAAHDRCVGQASG